MENVKDRPDDAKLRRRLKELLLARSELWVESLEVGCREGEFVISGRVPSYYMKQLVQTVALRAFPGVRLRNETVVPPD